MYPRPRQPRLDREQLSAPPKLLEPWPRRSTTRASRRDDATGQPMDAGWRSPATSAGGVTGRTASRAGQLGTSQPSTDGPGLRIICEAAWVAFRKRKSDAVAAFVKKRGHLFATPLENLTGAEGATFWDYQNVPLKVDITDLRDRKVTFTCKNYLQVLNLAFAHYVPHSLPRVQAPVR